MEDYQLDIMIGEGPAARSIKLNLPPFTLVGRDHARRPADLAAARSLRHRAAPRVLRHRRDSSASCMRSAGILGVADRRRRARAHRAALARHAAHRQPAAAPGARLRAGARPTATSMSRSRIAALDLLEVDPQGFDTLDRKLLLHHHRALRRRPGRHRQPRRGDRRGARHARGCRSSRSSSSRASWRAPRAGAWRRARLAALRPEDARARGRQPAAVR